MVKLRIEYRHGDFLSHNPFIAAVYQIDGASLGFITTGSGKSPAAARKDALEAVGRYLEHVEKIARSPELPEPEEVEI